MRRKKVDAHRRKDAARADRKQRHDGEPESTQALPKRPKAKTRPRGARDSPPRPA